MSNVGTIDPEPETGRTEPSGLARYQVLRELGRGTTGVVYEAYDVVLGQTVALKTIPIPPAVAPAERHEFVRRFLAEARIVARLSHPNIVEVHDFGQDPVTGTLFIALEHLDGAPLAEVVTALEWFYRDALVADSGAAARALDRGVARHRAGAGPDALAPPGPPRPPRPAGPAFGSG